MEEKTETQHVSNVELNITKMQWETTRGRLVINTDKGRITCKPKKEVRTMVRGIEVIDSAPMDVNDLPEKVFEVQRRVNEKGSVKVVASYQYFETVKDGETVTYRFLNSIKQFENWEIKEEASASSPSPSQTEIKPQEPIIKSEGTSYSQIEKVNISDAVMPQKAKNEEKAKAYQTFLHEQHSLQEKLSLGRITQDQYNDRLAEAMNVYISTK